MDIQGNSGDILDEIGEHVIGNQKKGDPCYRVEKSFTELCLAFYGR